MIAAREVNAAREPIDIAKKRQQLTRDFREDFDTFEYLTCLFYIWIKLKMLWLYSSS